MAAKRRKNTLLIMFRKKPDRWSPLVRIMVAFCVMWMVSLVFILHSNLSAVDDFLRKTKFTDGSIAKAKRYFFNPKSRLAQFDLPSNKVDTSGGEGKKQLRKKYGLVSPEDTESTKHKSSKQTDIDIPKERYELPVKYNPSAPGQYGKGVKVEESLLSGNDILMYQEGYRRNGFNQYASDMIPLDRYLGDVRDKECSYITYSKTLPDASVVIIFHNEAWSVLWRTVHSIRNSSPKHLLKSIILVDDASTQDHLGKPLDKEVEKQSGVHLIRTRKRSGLIRARNLGFSIAKTKVVIFLDSHCECSEGWLEPLLDRIHKDDSTVAIPLADTISADTFEFIPASSERFVYGGFDFDLYFNWRAVPEREQRRRNGRLNPIWTPTFLGCCFAVSADWFRKIGQYDGGLFIWGSENMELSFKTWMCGGRLEIVPCSHVGHLFRARIPYTWEGDSMRILMRNALRVADVWMDDYKKIVHDRIFYQNYDIDIGDVSDRRQLRQNLTCRSFDWYIKTVYPELYVPTGCKATGHIESYKGYFCIDSPTYGYMYDKPPPVKMCGETVLIQHWTLTKENTIRRDEGCLGYDGQNSLLVKPCVPHGIYLQWNYTQDETIRSFVNNVCLEITEDNTNVLVRPCTKAINQKWKWQRRTLTVTVD